MFGDWLDETSSRVKARHVFGDWLDEISSRVKARHVCLVTGWMRLAHALKLVACIR